MLRPSLYRTIPQTLLSLALALSSASVLADNTAQTLPFYQDWSDNTLITTDDDWAGVPGITGYTGEELANTSEIVSVNPQIVVDGTNSTEQVIPFYFDPNDVAHVGIGEFSVFLGQVVVMRGSPSTDAPFLLINLDTTGQDNIRVRYTLQDKDPSSRNAVTQVALQYRIGTTGDFTNIPEAYVADATEPNTATKTTEVAVMLPSAVNDKPHIQLRIITTNYVYTPPPIDLPDEWVGIDNIDIAGNVPVLSIGDSNATELDAAGCPVPMMFTVTSDRPAPLGDIAFTYSTLSGTATGDEDYTHVGPGSGNGMIFQNNTSAMITMDILCDDISEPDETFTVALGSPPDLSYLVANQPEPFLNGIGIGTIIDDDRPVLSIADSNVLEGNSPGCANTQMIFTVTSDVIATSDIDFGYTALSFTGDTATQDVDYTTILLGAGAGTISTGNDSTTIPVTIVCDNNVELNEKFTVRLTGAGAAYDVGPDAKGTILDDDGPIVSISDVTEAEGNVGTTGFVFRLQLSEAAPFDLNFTINTQDGTAIAGNDYEELGGSLLLPQGATFVDFTVDVYGDTTVEPNETFTVNVASPIGNPSPLFANGTILNNDYPLVPTFEISNDDNDQLVYEGNGDPALASFTVRLFLPMDAPPGASYSVAASTIANTAQANTDFVPVVAQNILLSEAHPSERVYVEIVNDAVSEGAENFSLDLANPSGGAVIGTMSANVTVMDDDSVLVPTLAISSNTTEVTENSGSAAFTVRVFMPQAGGFSGPFTVDVYGAMSSTATPGLDFSYTPEVIELSPDHLSQVVYVTIIPDNVHEDTETLALALINSTGGAVIGDSSASVDILDSLSVTEPTVYINDAAPVYESNGTPPDSALFNISLLLPNPAPAGPFSVDVNTMVGTATAGDFTPVAAQTVVLTTDAPSQVVAVNITDDVNQEPTENFTVELSNPLNVVIGDGSGLGTILDKVVDVPTFIISNPGDVDEGIGSVDATVTLLLPPGENGPYDVMVAAESGIGSNAAQAGEDYTFGAQILQLSGASPSAIVTVNIIDDDIGENTETFDLRLSDASPEAIIGDGTGHINILENDGGFVGDDLFADGFKDGFE